MSRSPQAEATSFDEGAERAPVVTEALDVGDSDRPGVGREQPLEPRIARLRVGWCVCEDRFTSSAMALFTAVPIDPDELSTCSSAGETRSRNTTAPSAASTGAFFATFLISVTACLIRVIAGCDFQPKA